MNPIVKNIPNSITCINLAAGCMAIVAAAHAYDPLWGLMAFQWAFIFIAVGAVADFFDGFAARALHAYSNLGKELDSLCDLVTFGVAPAMIMFNLLAAQQPGSWICWAALLIPVAGAIRLARHPADHFVHWAADSGKRHILDWICGLDVARSGFPCRMVLLHPCPLRGMLAHEFSAQNVLPQNKALLF